MPSSAWKKKKKNFFFFFFNDTATTEIYTLSLHDALPIYVVADYSLPAYFDNFIYDAIVNKELREELAEKLRLFEHHLRTKTPSSDGN